MTPKNVFDQRGYVVLKDALTKHQCHELTNYMFKLYDEGKLEKDEQCPLSDSVYGDPLFDDLLQKFAEPIGQHIGKKLLPTYTYARIYRPGEVLAAHKDRPACQYSATLTLGYDAKIVWPIYFDEQKESIVHLEVGELAVYSGCDVLHWRPAFKGKWQVQVFLHYVDADGPYASEYKDGRSAFGIKKEKKDFWSDPQTKAMMAGQKTKRDIHFHMPIRDGVMIPSNDKDFPGYFPITLDNMPELMFTKEECQKIISLTEEFYPGSASVGTAGNGILNREIRSAQIYLLNNDEENKWIFDKVAEIVAICNAGHFDYDIMGITHSLQLIHYTTTGPINGHYNWHIDSGPGAPATRKISFTAQLSSPEDYTGCELHVNDHAETRIATKEQGSVHLFPSYMPHQVTPIESGERWALVIWVHGSRRFR